MHRKYECGKENSHPSGSHDNESHLKKDKHMEKGKGEIHPPKKK